MNRKRTITNMAPPKPKNTNCGPTKEPDQEILNMCIDQASYSNNKELEIIIDPQEYNNLELSDSQDELEVSSSSDDFQPDDYLDEENDDNGQIHKNNNGGSHNSINPKFREPYLSEFHLLEWELATSGVPLQSRLPLFIRCYKEYDLFNDSPLEFFKLIFDDKIIEDITLQTNKAAGERALKIKKQETKRILWRNITTEEMKAFLGVFILMGLNQGNTREFWKDDTIDNPIGISEIMPKSKFVMIWKNLSLVPISDSITTEKNLSSISFHDRIIQNSQMNYNPSRELLIDEMIMPFHVDSKKKGNTLLKMKLYSRRYKVFVLNEAQTGYILNWKFLVEDEDDSDIERHIDYVNAKKLIEPYLKKGHHIYMDKYYTSLDLFKYLLTNDTGACGKTSLKRMNLSRVQRQNCENIDKKGVYFYVMDSHFLLSVLVNIKKTAILSTFHNPVFGDTEADLMMDDEEEDEPAPKTSMNEEKQVSKRPEALHDYMRFMNEFESFSQLLAEYQLVTKFQRWSVCFFSHFLHIAIVNSYIIYKTYCLRKNMTPMNRFDYHSCLASELVKPQQLRQNILDEPLSGQKRKPNEELEDLVKELDSQKLCVKSKCHKNVEISSNVLSQFRWVSQ